MENQKVCFKHHQNKKGGGIKTSKGPLSTPGPEVDALFMVQSHLFRSDYDLFHNHVILHNNKFLGPPPTLWLSAAQCL